MQVAPQGEASAAYAVNALFLVEVEQVAQAQDVTSGSWREVFPCGFGPDTPDLGGRGDEGSRPQKVHENSIRDE